MHDCLAEKYWHNYSEIWPATSGLSVKYISDILIYSSEAPPPKTWYVDDSGSADFTTIQDAVNAANAEDTIIVRDRTYTENVDVNKRLTIKSENGSGSTLLQPAEKGPDIFKVTADYVNISRLAVDGLGPLTYTPEAIGTEISQGFDIYHSNHCTITGNTVLGNSTASTY
jgi:nitrous oxidase accessory protein NosD